MFIPTTALLGFYSQQSVDLGYGTSMWNTPDGKQVEITVVLRPGTEDSYQWPDKKFVGLVTTWARVGRPDTTGYIWDYRSNYFVKETDLV